MKSSTRKLTRGFAATTAMVLVLGLGTPSGARADEADAKILLKAMSDYLAAQKALSFAYDATLEIVTAEQQKLGVASSGTATLQRPDKFRATRSGGFADMEMLFDSKTLTLLGKNDNLYSQIDAPGTVDQLIDLLQDKYAMPLPAADLLMSNVYDELMLGVVDIKDLGSGVIGGAECDHLAFRTEEVDWEIWIAHGDHPYPCRYVITSKLIVGAPQYSIQVRDWKAASQVAAENFNFKNPTAAEKVDLEDLPEWDELPMHFRAGGAQQP